MHFSPKNWEPTERTWHHIKAEILKKPCVKFEERRLNTLRETRICQRVNLNVSQKATPARPPGHHLFNNQIS